MGSELKSRGVRKSISAPSARADCAMVSSDRTTPLTCGRQASVATNIRIKPPPLSSRQGLGALGSVRRVAFSRRLVPPQNLKCAVVMFGDRGAAFDEVAGIDVELAADRLDRRVMDMAADHAVDVAARGLGRERRSRNRR